MASGVYLDDQEGNKYYLGKAHVSHEVVCGLSLCT